MRSVLQLNRNATSLRSSTQTHTLWGPTRRYGTCTRTLRCSIDSSSSVWATSVSTRTRWLATWYSTALLRSRRQQAKLRGRSECCYKYYIKVFSINFHLSLIWFPLPVAIILRAVLTSFSVTANPFSLSSCFTLSINSYLATGCSDYNINSSSLFLDEVNSPVSKAFK